MKELQVFKNPDFGSIRALELNGETWFVGKDVAEALGYGIGKSLANAVASHVDPEDKGVTEMMTPGGKQGLTIINESGLYSLIMSSKMPKAKEFKRWVTSEVLPSIRKHGAYMTPATIEKVLSDPDTIIKLATELKEERTARQQLEAKSEADRPKVIFAEAVAASSTSILIGELAKMLNQNGVEMGQKRLFEWMRQHGYLIRKKGSDYNMPTQRSMEMHLFEIKESVHVDGNGCNRTTRTPKVTGKGQTYFINKFLGEVRA